MFMTQCDNDQFSLTVLLNEGCQFIKRGKRSDRNAIDGYNGISRIYVAVHSPIFLQVVFHTRWGEVLHHIRLVLIQRYGSCCPRSISYGKARCRACNSTPFDYRSIDVLAWGGRTKYHGIVWLRMVLREYEPPRAHCFWPLQYDTHI